MADPVVEFTPDELRRYAYAGIDRRISAIEKRRKGAHGFNRDDYWQIDVEGVLAEAAVAKFLGLDFAPVTDALDTAFGDVAAGVQVRSTRHLSGSLLLHNTDAEDHRFVLVTGASGKYVLRGWIQAKWGRDPLYWRVYKGRGAYWVPQHALRAMGDRDGLLS